MPSTEKKQNTSSMVAIEHLFTKFQYALSQSEDKNVEAFMKRLQQLVLGNNTLILKSISELLPLNFFVDDYQRGYKWTKTQVEDLLNDIDEFNTTQSDFYCLQPVVTKYHAPKYSEDSPLWEVVDGQQRMTTSYMILSYLQHDKFSIEYRTRKSSSEFLAHYLPSTLKITPWGNYIKQFDSISDEQYPSPALSQFDLDNVDNYHFYTAYHTISEWFSRKSEEQKHEWLDKFLNHTKVIWYSVESSQNNLESIDIFMRLNSGKIPLTNAELIKALFLHFVSSDEETEISKLKQHHMSQQWDIIEQSLQTKDFWAFLQPFDNSQDYTNHIEFLFDLLTKKPTKQPKNTENDKKYHSFSYYYLNLKNTKEKTDYIEQEWHKLRQGFYRLQEWYDNDELYHLVGFLITRKVCTVQKLWKMSEGVTKSDFIESLKSIIGIELKKYFVDNHHKPSFSALQYGGNRQHIISVFILFNIAAHRRQGTRLSFNSYANTQWDIEHIHARNSQELEDTKQQDIWHESQIHILASEDIPEETKTNLNKLLSTWNQLKVSGSSNKELKDSQQVYLTLLDSVIGTIEEEEMDDLDNLCLLSSTINRGIGNLIFTQKRQSILRYEKYMCKNRTNHFIPIATKNVFSKFYSEKVANMYQWSAKDRKAYRKEIIECINYYCDIEGLK